MEGMSESLLTFLQHLREFGLVFQRKVRSWRKPCQRLVFILIAVVDWRSELCLRLEFESGCIRRGVWRKTNPKSSVLTPEEGSNEKIKT